MAEVLNFNLEKEEAPFVEDAKRGENLAWLSMLGAIPALGFLNRVGPKTARRIRELIQKENKARGPVLGMKTVPLQQGYGEMAAADSLLDAVTRGRLFRGDELYPKPGETWAERKVPLPLTVALLGEPAGVSTSRRATVSMEQFRNRMSPLDKKLFDRLDRERWRVKGQEQIPAGYAKELEELWGVLKTSLPEKDIAKAQRILLKNKRKEEILEKIYYEQEFLRKRVTRNFPLIGGPPSERMLPGWIGPGTEKANQQLKDAYLSALKEAGLERTKKTGWDRLSPEDIESLLYSLRKMPADSSTLGSVQKIIGDIAPFGRAFTKNLRQKGYEGIVYAPGQFAEWEVRIFDPAKLLVMDYRLPKIVGNKIKPVSELVERPYAREVDYLWEGVDPGGHGVLKSIYRTFKPKDVERIVEQIKSESSSLGSISTKGTGNKVLDKILEPDVSNLVPPPSSAGWTVEGITAEASKLATEDFDNIHDFLFKKKALGWALGPKVINWLSKEGVQISPSATSEQVLDLVKQAAKAEKGLLESKLSGKKLTEALISLPQGDYNLIATFLHKQKGIEGTYSGDKILSWAAKNGVEFSPTVKVKEVIEYMKAVALGQVSPTKKQVPLGLQASLDELSIKENNAVISFLQSQGIFKPLPEAVATWGSKKGISNPQKLVESLVTEALGPKLKTPWSVDALHNSVMNKVGFSDKEGYNDLIDFLHKEVTGVGSKDDASTSGLMLKWMKQKGESFSHLKSADEVVDAFIKMAKGKKKQPFSAEIGEGVKEAENLLNSIDLNELSLGAWTPDQIERALDSASSIEVKAILNFFAGAKGKGIGEKIAKWAEPGQFNEIFSDEAFIGNLMSAIEKKVPKLPELELNAPKLPSLGPTKKSSTEELVKQILDKKKEEATAMLSKMSDAELKEFALHAKKVINKGINLGTKVPKSEKKVTNKALAKILGED